MHQTSMRYRIIYKKQTQQYHIQKLEVYTSWFGFGKQKERWVYVKKWYPGSDYPPYSEDTYQKFFSTTLKDAQKYLEEVKNYDMKPDLEVL